MTADDWQRHRGRHRGLGTEAMHQGLHQESLELDFMRLCTTYAFQYAVQSAL